MFTLFSAEKVPKLDFEKMHIVAPCIEGVKECFGQIVQNDLCPIKNWHPKLNFKKNHIIALCSNVFLQKK